MIAPAEKPAGPRRDPAQKLVPWRLGGEKEMAAGNVIITAARMRAHGETWEAAAEKTGRPARELMQFTLKNPGVWEPLCARAERLRLAEAEGRMLRRLLELAATGPERERGRAAEEILVHRRFVARGRNKPPRRQEELRGEKPRLGLEKAPYPAWLVREPPPEGRDIFYAAHCLSRGASWEAAAGDMKEPLDGVLLWPFIHPASWDRAYLFARLESARQAAALAVNEMEKLAGCGSDEAVIRAAHALLVHRRHMHWGSLPPRFTRRGGHQDAFALTTKVYPPRRAPRHEEGGEQGRGGQRAKPGRVPDGPSGPRGGEVTSQNRTRDGAAGTSFGGAAQDGESRPAESPGGESRASPWPRDGP